MSDTNVMKCRAQHCPVMVMLCRYKKPPHKLAPIEVDPSDDGNVLVTGTSYEILNKEEQTQAKLNGYVLRKNHYATCKFGKLFRDKAAKAKGAATT